MAVYNSIHTGTQIDDFDTRITTNANNITALNNTINTTIAAAINSLNTINIYSAIVPTSGWTWYNDGSGITQDATTYENKWYWQRYASQAMADNIQTTLNTLTTVATNYYNDSATSITMNMADSYTGRATCYIYCANDVNVSMRFETDDDGRVFLNDELIVKVASCAWTAYQTLHFKKGENKLVVCYTEGSGGDGWICDPKPSGLVGTSFLKMTAVPMGGYTQTVTVTKLGNSSDLTSNTILFGPKVLETTWAALEGQRYLATMAVCTPLATNNQITIKTSNNVYPTVDLTCYWLGYG